MQKNIRVYQGNNYNYDDSNLDSQRIIFYFEIINILDKFSTDAILTRKLICRIILTIYK